jgi:mono/diheme cytochrome c family protein
LRGFAAVAVLLPALVVVTGRAADTAPLPAFADADNPALVEAGAAIYASHCALCHGEAGSTRDPMAAPWHRLTTSPGIPGSIPTTSCSAPRSSAC